MRILIPFLILAPLAAVHGEENKPVFRDAATHEQLAHKLKIANQDMPVADLSSARKSDPSVVNQPSNLVETSDIISFNGLTTLVPKRAIITLPEAYRNRINNHTPGNRVVNWTEFYTSNRGWITTVEVSRVQAEGNEPLDEELAKQLTKNRNLIIATYSRGPISMLPLKRPEVETANASQP